MKNVIPIVSDDHPTPTQSPSTTHTNLPQSFVSSIMGSPDSRNKPLYFPTRKQTTIQDLSKGHSSFDHDRGSHSRSRLNGHRSEATWSGNNTQQTYYESRTNRNLIPQSSFFESGRPGLRRVGSWHRALQKRIRNALLNAEEVMGSWFISNYGYA
ncbi:hypothetical protein BT96DRAFT_918054 [Gymnopus androsaceus JB14]|uniref:Uncharacterized protein n=1 Tax=Gymnopus androsaceus JB14 TaxID=1447944 RepID=A0A6A4HX10_9AGAR|nr:hypothetical protein BT96DRAFT_918054 [Gymnopus androsaceus JB14]